MKKILVVGAGGQIGTELVPHLQKNYGYDNVIAADLRPEIVEKLSKFSRAVPLNALDMEAYAKIVKKLSEEYGLYFVALQDKFLEKATQYGAEYYLFDGIHPTPIGAKLIAEEWLKIFHQIQ